jgi:hypothetical protein
MSWMERSDAPVQEARPREEQIRPFSESSVSNLRSRFSSCLNALSPV